MHGKKNSNSPWRRNFLSNQCRCFLIRLFLLCSKSIDKISSGQNKVCFSKRSCCFHFLSPIFPLLFFVLCFEITAAARIFTFLFKLARLALVRIGTICYSVFRPFLFTLCAEASVQHFLFVVCTLWCDKIAHIHCAV